MDAVVILGCAIMAGCVAIQRFVVSILLRVLLIVKRRLLIRHTLFGTTGVLIAVMLILVSGNLLQVALWAAVFVARGEFLDLSTAFYHSLVNFTTLGYGDLVMSETGRILGALEAANGVVMFGLTTSVVFLVLSAQMQSAWDERIRRG